MSHVEAYNAAVLSEEIEKLSAPDLALGQVDRFELELAIQTLPDTLREPLDRKSVV